MGLFQKAIETYDANASLVGIYREGHEPLAPIGHTLTSAAIEITIDNDGHLLSARSVDKSEPKVLIPVTEKSAGRSGTKANESPHPLCDKLDLLIAEPNFFLPQLEKWANSSFSHPFLHIILKCIRENDLLGFLNHSIEKLSKDGLVVWRVNGVTDEEPACWKNTNLFSAYTQYYLDSISDRDMGICLADGSVVPIALQHPKGVVAFNGNAKLISDNDSSGFTYRGRFVESGAAASMGYLSSQKAHNALRWLVSEQAVSEVAGNGVFICWNPQGKRLPRPMRRFRDNDAEPTRIPSDYKNNLQSSLFSFRKDHQLTDTDNVVIVSLDAATPGRLAVTYYNELSVKTFFDKLEAWENHCCWYNGPFGIQSPNLLSIIDMAFGTQRGQLIDLDVKLKRQQLQRVLDCKINGGIFPADILHALTQRASMPLAYTENNWRKLMFITCAVLQKYRYDTRQGGSEMGWSLDKHDRSFQFGRLLAIMERAELDYYYRTGEARQTNAIKFMAEFRQRPFYVFERVNRTLHQAYLNRIEKWQADRYERLTGEVFTIIRDFDEKALNKPLDDLYLMGYELQRNAFFEKKEKNETEE